MKKIAIASAAMGGAALIAFGASGTFAAFSDSEDLAGAAGATTLDLEVGDTQLPTQAAALELAPGSKTVYFPYFVENAGDMNGFLGANIVLTDVEDGCSGNEQLVDPDCDVQDAPGEFSSEALFSVRYVEGGTAAGCTENAGGLRTAVSPTSIPAGLPRSLSVPAQLPIPSGYSICVVVGVQLPADATNAVQGDSAELDVELRLEQLRQAGNIVVPV